MNNNYEVRYAVGQRETNQMGTQALRDEFLIEQVFGTCAVNCLKGSLILKIPLINFLVIIRLKN